MNVWCSTSVQEQKQQISKHVSHVSTQDIRRSTRSPSHSMTRQTSSERSAIISSGFHQNTRTIKVLRAISDLLSHIEASRHTSLTTWGYSYRQYCQLNMDGH